MSAMTTAAPTHGSTWPNGLDTSVLDAMISIRSAPLTTVFTVITTIGNTVSMFLIAVVAVLWLLARGQRLWAACCAGTWLVAVATMQLLKIAFGRQRPPMPQRLVEIDSLSFPSGHAMMSMAVLGVSACVIVALTGRRWPIPVAAAGTTLIGVSRIYLGAHWTTDVLAGWLLGAVIVAVAVRLTGTVRRDLAARPDPLDEPRDAAH